jgi:hypothetical protein
MTGKLCRPACRCREACRCSRVEAGKWLWLRLHALFQFRVVGKMRGQHLDGDGSLEPAVSGAIDFSPMPPAPSSDSIS